MLKDYQKEL